RVTRRFSASAERVFDAWLDPSRLGKWLFATPTGEMVRVEVDARVGGRWVLTERRDGEDVEHTGEYLEIDRPRRLAFTLVVPKYSKDVDRVEVDIVALDGGGCELTLTHEMAGRDDFAEGARQGWGMVLDGLAAVVDG
ncbi:MAG TPA: SRPBCC domain-containing protein, partial [Longimicrobium sp.]|nr:SRPBCC domain-containing protein [Longimicrobium sp.]